MSTRKIGTRAGALVAGSALIGMVTAMPAMASDGSSGGVRVINTETVQVYTDATGQVQNKRIYEQLGLTGHGSVDLKNPVDMEGLRNLDGFGGFSTQGSDQIVKTSVDGTKDLRSVSDYNGSLPLDVQVTYELDGKQVEPGDVVGKSGDLQVTYTVRNVTAQTQRVSFPDGGGGTVTKDVQVPIPMVGSLTTTLPGNFRDVTAPAANMGGDGKGGTSLSFTMTLFPPIGSDTASFGYTAKITDGVVPEASVSALPVNPLASPTFASAADSYHGGAQTGAELVDGATQIDSNLLKLRDGAAKLLAGLIRLNDGAAQLHSGLADTAVPGSRRIATGADDLATGLARLKGGALQLRDGTGTASAGSRTLSKGAKQLRNGIGAAQGGTGDVAKGARQLAKGQRGLARGLKTLHQSVENLPASVQKQLGQNEDYSRLLGGLTAIANGVGSRSDRPTSGTLLGGINAIQYGMRAPGQSDCSKVVLGQEPTNCGALDGIDFLASTVKGSLNGPPTQSGTLAQLLTGFDAIAATPDCGVICKGTVGAVKGAAKTQLTQSLGLIEAALSTISTKVQTQLLNPGAGLDQLRAGLDAGTPGNCDAPGSCGIKQAALTIQEGVPMLVSQLVASIQQQLLDGIGKPTKGCDPNATLRCGSAALVDGSSQLADGVNQLAAGMSQLRSGGIQLSGGARDLASGLDQLDSGAGQLAEGAGTAKTGSDQLSDGAHQLADGLGTAADGSGQIADGLSQAAKEAPAIPNGAQELSTQGTRKLIAAGQSTTEQYGQMYATIKAGAERAKGHSMIVGAPAGAAGLAAYNYVIKGDDGEGGRNVSRTVGGVILLGLAGGALALRRRFSV